MAVFPELVYMGKSDRIHIFTKMFIRQEELHCVWQQNFRLFNDSIHMLYLQS